MTPDKFMPFYGAKFLGAVEGRPDWLAMGYLRLLVCNWEHLHCAGLDNEKDFLKGVARVKDEHWQQFWKIVFDNNKFFTLGADGLWHQKRQDEEWVKATENYNKQLNRAKKGAKMRWKEHKRK